MGFLDDVLWKAKCKKDTLVFNAKYMRLRTLNTFDDLFGGIKMEIGWAIDDTVAAIKNKFESKGSTSLTLSDKKLNELATASCELEAMKSQVAETLRDMNDKEHLMRCELGLAVSLEYLSTGVAPISDESKEIIECLIFGASGIESAPTVTKNIANLVYTNGLSLEDIAGFIEEAGFTTHSHQTIYWRIFSYMLDFDMKDPNSLSPDAAVLVQKWIDLTSNW
ncbi:hypothetical protein ACQ7RL_000424 [Photobacterium damselae]|uniref:hypothetical protein n=1 Tax=Photobacterium damselae TaxID=38293 RepID=UPI00370CAB55